MLYDVCVPTARYLGEKGKDYTEKGIKILENVFLKASDKIKLQKSDLDGSDWTPSFVPILK